MLFEGDRSEGHWMPLAVKQTDGLDFYHISFGSNKDKGSRTSDQEMKTQMPEYCEHLENEENKRK